MFATTGSAVTRRSFTAGLARSAAVVRRKSAAAAASDNVKNFKIYRWDPNEKVSSTINRRKRRFFFSYRRARVHAILPCLTLFPGCTAATAVLHSYCYECTCDTNCCAAALRVRVQYTSSSSKSTIAAHTPGKVTIAVFQCSRR